MNASDRHELPGSGESDPPAGIRTLEERQAEFAAERARYAASKARFEDDSREMDLDPEYGNHELQLAKEALNAVQNQDVVYGPWPEDYDAILAAINTARKHLRTAERMARAQKRAARATQATKQQ